MKSMIFVTIIASTALCGCSDMMGTMDMQAGNPNGTAYAGSPGSVYSSADNPPKTIGTVSYDPNAMQPVTDPDLTPTPQGSPMPNTPGTPMPPRTR